MWIDDKAKKLVEEVFDYATFEDYAELIDEELEVERAYGPPPPSHPNCRCTIMYRSDEDG